MQMSLCMLQPPFVGCRGVCGRMIDATLVVVDRMVTCGRGSKQGNRTGANMPHTLTKVNPITALANASLNALQIYTVN